MASRQSGNSAKLPEAGGLSLGPRRRRLLEGTLPLVRCPPLAVAAGEEQREASPGCPSADKAAPHAAADRRNNGDLSGYTEWRMWEDRKRTLKSFGVGLVLSRFDPNCERKGIPQKNFCNNKQRRKKQKLLPSAFRAFLSVVFLSAALSMRAARGIINVSAAGLFIRVRSDLITNSGRAHPHRAEKLPRQDPWFDSVSGSTHSGLCVHERLGPDRSSAERGLVKVPEGFFSAEHPNTKMMANLLMQGDYTRLRSLMDRSNAGATAIFQVADRGCQNNKRSMFHRQAVLYLSLVGLAIYYSTKVRQRRSSSKRAEPPCCAANSPPGCREQRRYSDVPSPEYIAVLMESFDCVAPLIRLRFWEPYEDLLAAVPV
uniref:Transmembrane protein n=1 Tax=Macrostomum lignano TaxID=282301 RepID=A0A1I8F782_9PLAT